MKKIILFIISILILLNISNVYWCSCVWNSTPYSAYKSADIVFIGTVIKTEKIPKYNNTEKKPRLIFQDNLSTFKIESNIKGNSQEIVQIKTDWVSSCAFGFYENSTYIVYADKKKDQLIVKPCGQTKHISRANEDIDAFQHIINWEWYNLKFMLESIKHNIFEWIFTILFFIIIWWIIYKVRKNKHNKKIWKK